MYHAMVPLRRRIGDTAMPTKLIVLCGEQGWRCAYCGVRFVMSPRNHDHAASFDEVIPRSSGGLAEWDNQVAACRGCNTARKSFDAYAFYALVQAGEGVGRERKILAEQAARAPSGRLVFSTIRSAAAKLAALKRAREIVPMTEARAAYFRVMYGFVPGQTDQSAVDRAPNSDADQR